MRGITMSAHSVRALLTGTKTQTRRVKRSSLAALIGLDGEGCDDLYVKETWRVDGWDESAGQIRVQYRADGWCRPDPIAIEDPDYFLRLWQQSSDDAIRAGLEPGDDDAYHWEPGCGPTRWRSPRFMPRAAARLFLRVVEVRPERLQDISLTDVLAEGYESWEAFRAAWNALNRREECRWDANPTVWVLTFRLVRDLTEEGVPA